MFEKRKKHRNRLCLLLLAASIACTPSVYGAPENNTKQAAASPVQDPNSNESKIYKSLRIDVGLNHAAACGIMGNIRHESNFRSTIYGDGGTSYGICQWHAGRFTRLKNYCSSNGYDYTTIEGQLKYLQYELNAFYPAIMNYLKSVPDTEQGCRDAAEYFCVHFEAPANRYEKGKSRASEAVKNYYTKIFAFSTNGKEVVRYLIPFVRP